MQKKDAEQEVAAVAYQQIASSGGDIFSASSSSSAPGASRPTPPPVAAAPAQVTRPQMPNFSSASLPMPQSPSQTSHPHFTSSVPSSSTSSFGTADSEESSSTSTLLKMANYKNQLQDWCVKNKYAFPDFNTTSYGPPHLPRWKV